MHFSETVVIAREGVCVDPRKLEPIGIFDRSVCWGLRVPDWRSRLDGGAEALKSGETHFLVSPFEPESWPFLLRLELKLRDRLGALGEVTAILKRMHLNILAIEGTPSGYYHATVNVIAEAEKQKAGDPLRFLAGIAEADRHPNNDRIWRKIHETWVRQMLRLSATVEERIKGADQRRSFLHAAFVAPGEHRRGVLYSAGRFRKDRVLHREAQRQQVKAVRCHWLQNLAFNWVYGANVEHPVKLTCRARRSTLEVPGGERRAFRDAVQADELPVKSIACIDTSEKYMRVIVPRAQIAERLIRMDVPYASRFDATRSSSRGFLDGVCRILQARDIEIKNVSRSSTSLTQKREEGVMRFVSLLPEAVDKRAEIATLQDAINRYQRDDKFSLRERPTVVTALGAHRLFISTGFEFMDQRRQLFDLLDREVKRLGFRPTYGSKERLLKEDGDLADEDSVTRLASRLIERSAALLLVMPATQQKTDWMLFELGMAVARGLPREICIAGARSKMMRERLEPLADNAVHSFDESANDRAIIDRLKPALLLLVRRVRGQGTAAPALTEVTS